MTRIIAAMLLVLVVSADLDGTRRMDHDNRMCARLGAHYERHGLTVRERDRLTRRHCKASGGTWVSDRFYTA